MYKFSFLLTAFALLTNTLWSNFTEIDLTGNIETIGVIVSGTAMPPTANLQYRVMGDANWINGHALTLIDDGRLVTSVFDLKPTTNYEIKVTQGGDEILGTVATQSENITFIPSNTLYVDASASIGGDGSVFNPFVTIQEAVSMATPGSEILVANGIYNEQVTITSSGSMDQWIRIKAVGSSVVMDGSITLSNDLWTPHPTIPNVWMYEMLNDNDHFYLARDDQEQSYRYPDFNGLQNEQGLQETPMAEGWYMEPGTSTLYLRSLTNPSNHSWQLADLEFGFFANQKDWIWIEGFNIKYYGSVEAGRGIQFSNCSNIIIRNNTLRNNMQGIEIYWDGNESQGNNTRIEFNNISDPPVDSWPWEAVKYSTAETSAIILNGHRQIIVRNNEMHHLFNGIYAGRWGDLENVNLNTDIDVYRNTLHHIGDDGLEPEGACVNNRFRINTFDTGLVPISLAPITYGPVWVLRNQFTNYNGTGLKFGIAEYAPDGRVFVYHNTLWTDSAHFEGITETMAAVTYYERSDNWVMRNNIFRGTWYAFRHKVPEAMVDHDWDYDNWYTTENEGYFIMNDNIIYENSADFYAATGLEQHGTTHPPLLADPYQGDFHLNASSMNVDGGVLIPGINNTYQGAAPDKGAYEQGQEINLNLTVYLEGTYDTESQLMNDDLRMLGKIPTTEPFTALGFVHIQGGGESMDSSIFDITGDNAIVDWILVELRSENDPSLLLATQSAVLQRDGDIVNINGISPVRFDNISEDNVFVVLRHRNHFGVRSLNTYPTNGNINIDFSDPNTPLYGNNAMTTIAGLRLLTAGDANNDGQINVLDINDFWRGENSKPYTYFFSRSDFDLNGSVNAVDKNSKWRPNNTKVEQLD